MQFPNGNVSLCHIIIEIACTFSNTSVDGEEFHSLIWKSEIQEGEIGPGGDQGSHRFPTFLDPFQ